jgi:hypothetical protein
MDPAKKRALIYVGAVMALAATIALVANMGPIASREVKLTSTNVEGEVLSIEVVPPKGNAVEHKEAIVKLASGETIRAFVPPTCVVHPGQWALLSHMTNDVVDIPFYVLKGPKKRNDS